MKNDDLTLYRTAYFIRCFELEIAHQSDRGEVPGLVHLCTGAEIAEVALAMALDPAIDQLTGSHRSHGLALAMGADPLKVAKEILGRAGGLSDGLGGTQHLMAPESGFLTSNGIVGAQVPLAAGAALSAKVRGTGGIGVAVFGDGAANQGAVLETMNLAVALGLPMLFVLENNGFGQSTASDYASGGASCAARAQSFGLLVDMLDGLDHREWRDVINKATDIARGGQPFFLEVSVPRLSGHYHGEDATYLLDTKAQDPLQYVRSALLNGGEAESAIVKLEAVERECAANVVTEAAFAKPSGPEFIADWHQKLGAYNG